MMRSDPGTLPPAPVDTGARPAPSALAKVAAVFGIVIGFLTWIVPGFFALRSYRRWRRGDIKRPTFAWVAAVVGPVIWVAILASLAVLYAAPLVRDDFSDRDNAWGAVAPPNTAAFVDGGFELAVGSPGRPGDFTISGLRWNEGSRPNVAVEADVRLMEGDALAGVGCFDAERGIGYLFALTADGEWQIRSVRDGRGAVIASGRLDADPIEGARLRGECRGGYGEHALRMFVDGSLVSALPVARTVFDYTAVALEVGALNEGPARARFDNVMAIAIKPTAD